MAILKHARLMHWRVDLQGIVGDVCNAAWVLTGAVIVLGVLYFAGLYALVR
jgi:hypothetical protein